MKTTINNIVKIFFMCLSITLSGCMIRQYVDCTGMEETVIYLNSHYLKNIYCIYIYQDLLRYEYRQSQIPSIPPMCYGTREGAAKNGKQIGLWKTTIQNYKESYIHREEFFKKGLHDGIYKIYNSKGEILYSTTFRKGTGLEKDFYDNGQLYYEIATKDGYFTDTLRLYDDTGKLVEKLFYEKDSLVFHKRIDENGYWLTVPKRN